MRSVVATIRYDDFEAASVYWEGTERWIKAEAVWQSKKRFCLRSTYPEFCQAIIQERRIETMTCAQGIIWMKATAHLHFRRPTFQQAGPAAMED